MGVPLRRIFGGLVSADKTVEVDKTTIPTPQPDVWQAAGNPGYGRGWSNPARDIPRPANAGRTEVIDTARDLELGPPPGRIERIANTRVAGLTNARVGNTFPATAGMGYIKHLPIGKITPAVVPNLRTISDDAWVGAVFAGNPVLK
jgi:hypothetical protein